MVQLVPVETLTDRSSYQHPLMSVSAGYTLCSNKSFHSHYLISSGERRGAIVHLSLMISASKTTK